jgi:hypothetical protein
MELRFRAHWALLAFASILAATGPARAADRPWTEGPVSVVNSIRTQPGMFDAYMKYLSTIWKSNMEEQKKAGIIVDYRVYSTTPRGPGEPNLYLVTTYANMAAMDGLADKNEAMLQRSFGDVQQRSAAAIEREKMREQVGSEMIRELVLK